MREVPFRGFRGKLQNEYNIEAFIVLKKEFAGFICLMVQVNLKALVALDYV